MSLWDIATDLEDVSVGLYQLQNLLQIYYEKIEDEMKFAGKYPTSYFIAGMICYVPFWKSCSPTQEIQPNASKNKSIRFMQLARRERRPEHDERGNTGTVLTHD